MQITKTSDGSINYPLYSLDGKLILEDNRQTLQRIEYIFAGGRLVAKRIQPITAAGANNGTATTTTIHTDFLGSPVAETNSAGTVTRVERYTPYGEPSDMQLDAGPGFTGHATDVATGLTYMQQRYYDADIGRFISPDPVGPEEDFVKHFNRYNYAYNNPVRYTDPDGTIGVLGFIVGAGIEAAVQVGSNMARGQDFGEAVSNIDVGDVVVAGAVSAIIPGLGNVAKTGYQSSKDIASAAKAIKRVSEKSANTLGRANKNAAAITRNAEKIKDATAEVGKAGVVATVHQVVKADAKERMPEVTVPDRSKTEQVKPKPPTENQRPKSRD